MHIKQVVLSGFRSFRHQSETEPFSPKHNVIIGRNGAGKSNFFAAIQFVLLAQRFLHLRQEERQALLHEGAGANVMTAFVEVVFDNSDGRMTVEGEEVVLRRTIGVKKDEFFLNRKRVTKQEVCSLLESAGFSRSNPYYIVQQGKVNALTLMKDEQRLDLLKEVAGTKVYEERREESLQIMQETNMKRTQIAEVVAYIDERLAELDEEKEELRAYQQLDKDRRALEYTVYDKELKQAREELTRAEEARLREIERADALHRELHEARDNLREVEQRLKSLGETLGRKEAGRAGVEAERESLIAQREAAANEERRLQERLDAEEAKQQEMQGKLAAVEKEIVKARKELEEKAEPEYQAAKAKVGALQKEVKEKEAHKALLYEKQGRKSAFKSAAERDKHLQQQLGELEAAVKERTRQLSRAQQEREKAAKQAQAEAGAVARKEQEIGAKQKALQGLGEERSKLTAVRDEKQDERKAKQERLDELEARKAELTRKVEKAKAALRFSIPKHIAQGLENVGRVVEEQGVRGYYGPVYDLITLKDAKFTQAVEVAAGPSLFNVVVDTDETAARLMKTLEEKGLGRVCFMPLNRLRVKPVTYPDSSDVVPLLAAALEYPREVERAMQQIFSMKLLARDLDVAARVSEAAHLDCITLEGDEASRKGSMQGGYHDEKASKLAQVLHIREAQAALRPLAAELSAEEKGHAALEQEMTRLLAELQKKDAEAAALEREVGALSQEIRQRKKAAEQAAAAAKQLGEEELPGHEAAIADLQAQAANYRAELGTPLDQALSAAESRGLQEVEAALPALEKETKAAADALAKKKSARTKLTYRLNENLVKKRDGLLEALTPDNGGTAHVKQVELAEAKRELGLKAAELQQVAKRVASVEAALGKMDEATEAERGEERRLKQQSEDARAEEARLKEAVGDVGKAQEKLLNKRAMALQKRDASLKKIQELGSLPAAELELYKNYGIKQLYKRLHECHEQLKKYGHVNKKALDQYVSFSEQREELLKRKQELEEGATAIEALVESLDRQKDEAIIRTFRGVSRHFADVFKELVPNGHGRMVMKTTADRTKDITGDDSESDEDEEEEEDDDEEEEESSEEEEGEGKKGRKSSSSGGGKGKEKAKKKGKGKGMKVSEFAGIQIQVSFTGQGDRYLMQQLSGGQKALVALALIFAIQRCDPAPFYLFDEVDQALDSTYRAAVASLIQRQAASEDSPAQFITTTFRPEMVRVADRCYGISLQNKVSSVDVLDKETALEFVRELQDEEEAVGGEAAKGGKKKKKSKKGKKGKAKAAAAEQEQEEEEEEELSRGGDGGESVSGAEGGEGEGEEESELEEAPKPKRKKRIAGAATN